MTTRPPTDLVQLVRELRSELDDLLAAYTAQLHHVSKKSPITIELLPRVKRARAALDKSAHV